MSAEPTIAAPVDGGPEPEAAPVLAWDLSALPAGGHAVLHDAEGRAVAAIVPLSMIDELATLRELVEDLEDSLLILEARLDRALSGEELIPHEQVRAELGL